MESFDVAKLQAAALRSKYQIKLKNRFEAFARENPSPGIDDEPNLVWKNIEKTVKQAAKKS